MSSYVGSYTGNHYDFDYSLDICPDILLSLLVGASAIAYVLIYQGITMATRRKKRSLGKSDLFLLGNIITTQLTPSFTICTFQIDYGRCAYGMLRWLHI